MSAFGDDPNTSQCKMAQQCEVSLSSVNRILRDEGSCPWKVKWVQELHKNDYQQRKDFCSTTLRRNTHDRNFVRNICFSDEAVFTSMVVLINIITTFTLTVFLTRLKQSPSDLHLSFSGPDIRKTRFNLPHYSFHCAR